MPTAPAAAASASLTAQHRLDLVLVKRGQRVGGEDGTEALAEGGDLQEEGGEGRREGTQSWVELGMSTDGPRQVRAGQLDTDGHAQRGMPGSPFPGGLCPPAS